MPHPRSPHTATSTDLAGGLGTIRSSKDVFCAPSPPRTQDSLTSNSHRPSLELSPTTIGIKKEPPSRNQEVAATIMMHIKEPEEMQWTSQHASPISQPGQAGSDYHITIPYTRSATDFYHYTRNGMSYNDNYNFTYSPQYPSPGCPRSYNGPDLNGLPNAGMTESYPPAAYLNEPPKHHELSALSDHGVNDDLMQMSSDAYEHHYGAHIKHEIQSDYHSPYSDTTRASTPDEPPRYPQDIFGVDHDPIDKEQPYAQLIYKALLQADGHTMILRDIYDWFKKFTDKASASETKGWQNSIRHNLSMNGAFEKVDQPCEESRKGFMWRLTNEALREGVKSTTRYRSKQPNKRVHRTLHPQPQRQASGAKGGQAARRSAHLKRSRRHMECSRQDVRSVPTAFDGMYGISIPQGSSSYPRSASPYYSSDADFEYLHKDHAFSTTNSALPHNGQIDFFPPQAVHPYTGSPMLEGAYVLEQSPAASLFTNSPSPSALDEPKTPLSQGGWSEDVALQMRNAFGCEDGAPYQEYAG